MSNVYFLDPRIGTVMYYIQKKRTGGVDTGNRHKSVTRSVLMMCQGEKNSNYYSKILLIFLLDKEVNSLQNLSLLVLMINKKELMIRYKCIEVIH